MRPRVCFTALLLACVFASAASAQVSGFGVASTPSQVPGFGGSQTVSEKPDQSAAPKSERPRERPRRSESSDQPRRQRRQRESSASSNRPTQSLAAQTDGYVRSLMDQNDKNRDRRLDGDELKSLPSNLTQADSNRDQVITFDELRTHVMALNASSGSGSSGSRSPAATSVQADRVATSRRSDRLASREKRPPAELPSRLKSRDRDGDGQVAMSEYSRSWTESLATEFRRYDKNNDGVITAKEAN
jgi:Ca2+-binding EF-hand superfamily protein